MFSFCRKLAVLILMAGLPLQTMHAYAMPFCDHDAPAAQTSEHHAHEADAAEHHEHAPNSGVKLVCDGCSMCNACSAPAIASAAIDVLLDPIQTQPPILTSHLTLFFPEQLQRPPSQFLA